MVKVRRPILWSSRITIVGVWHFNPTRLTLRTDHWAHWRSFNGFNRLGDFTYNKVRTAVAPEHVIDSQWYCKFESWYGTRLVRDGVTIYSRRRDVPVNTGSSHGRVGVSVSLCTKTEDTTNTRYLSVCNFFVRFIVCPLDIVTSWLLSLSLNPLEIRWGCSPGKDRN